MTLFIVIAAAMVATALAWVLVPLLKRGRHGGVARDALNVAILRDQIGELEADLATGAMPREQYEEARRELERRVLDDSTAMAVSGRAPAQSAAWTAAILAGTIPIAALLLYVVLGSHEAFAPNAMRGANGGAERDVTPQQIEAMAAKLAARLEQEPNNVDGWMMLARTYDALNRHTDAVTAFERAVTLAPDNAAILADYADSIGAAQGGLSGKALELVERALKADPTQWKALALAGTAAYERKDYPGAVAYWERLKATVPAGSPISGSIDASIAEARALGGQQSGPTNATATPGAAPVVAAPAKATPGAAPAPSGATIAGSVTLAPALAGKVSPTDTVYIFARAAEGPKMPLAVLKKQVKDLPSTFTLDDSMAMAPNFALSKFTSIVVGVRVSKSGNATPQSGDFEGSSPTVKIGATGVAIVIDRMLP